MQYMTEALEIIVSGRVQFVMYRDYATRKARALGLVGDVQNLPSGTVRVRVEGTQPALSQYLEKLQKGSILSRVDSVDVFPGTVTGTYRNFGIVYG